LDPATLNHTEEPKLMRTKRSWLKWACVSTLAIGSADIAFLPNPAQAQVVVWSASSFTNDPVGSYGASVDFEGSENLTTIYSDISNAV
jgi:hypothetical protein